MESSLAAACEACKAVTFTHGSSPTLTAPNPTKEILEDFGKGRPGERFSVPWTELAEDRNAAPAGQIAMATCGLVIGSGTWRDRFGGGHLPGANFIDTATAANFGKRVALNSFFPQQSARDIS
jgi:hypothetical protein